MARMSSSIVRRGPSRRADHSAFEARAGRHFDPGAEDRAARPAPPPRPRSRRAGPIRRPPPRPRPGSRADHGPRTRAASVAISAPGATSRPGRGRLDPGLDPALEDVPARLQVALRGADVHPVPLQAQAMQPVPDQPREDIALDRDLLAGRNQLEHRALQDIHAGVDLSRDRLAGLLGELEHLARPRRCGPARRRRSPRPGAGRASPPPLRLRASIAEKDSGRRFWLPAGR